MKPRREKTGKPSTNSGLLRYQGTGRNHRNISDQFRRLPSDRGDYYRPAKITGTIQAAVMGNPSRQRVCTSHIERQNGTLRQWCNRMTRLTYAFSKSRENLRAALALHFAYYNLCRVHGSLRVTPAMEAGLTDHVWDLSELIAA